MFLSHMSHAAVYERSACNKVALRLYAGTAVGRDVSKDSRLKDKDRKQGLST